MSATPKAGSSSRPASPVYHDFAPSKEPSPPGSTLDPARPHPYEKHAATHPPLTSKKADSEAGTATDDTDTEATCSSDEFNWSDDEDAKSRKVAAEKKARRGRAVWLAFKKLARPVRTFLLAVIFGGIFVTPALIFLFVFPNNPAKPHVVPWSLWIGISWAVACALSLIVDLFPRFLLWIIFVIYGKAPETFKTQLELFMAVSFWLKLALDVSGMWVALSLIRKILHPPGRYWTVINQVMQAIFVAAIILLAEKVFVRIIAIRFHQKALADRLHENRIALKVLDKLSTAIPQFPIATKKKKKNRHSPGNSLDAGMVLGTGATTSTQASPFQSRSASPDLKVKGGANKKEYAVTKEGSAEGTKMEADGTTKVKRKKKSKAVADVLVDQLVDLKDAIGQVALKDSKFNKEAEIGSLYSARRLAKQLFSTLSDVYPPRSHLIVEDFYPYFRTEADAKVAFAQFDKDNNGDISKKEMREAVQRIYRERKALSASLKDMSSAVSKLDAVMIGVALIIILFVCLLIFNPGDNISSLIPLATIVLGFSFVFGNSAKTIFESLIFIFSTHVYDVGDLVLIDDMVLFVKEFGLFATTFRRVDGQEVVAPNSLLATAKLIHNVRRSGSMWETTNLQIGYETPLDIIEQLKVRLRQYMSENSREWGSPGVEIWIDGMKYQNCINLVIAIEHRNNWQEWGGRWARRGLFMKHLRAVLEELEIGYQMPLQPVSFHPSSMPPSWMTNNSAPSGLGSVPSLNPMFGNAGMLPRDPIRTVAPGIQLGMADVLPPQPTGPRSRNKAREILDGLSWHRIDPSRIKTTETKPHAKGGQGSILVGTMIPPEEVSRWVADQLLKTFLEKKFAIKKLDWNREDAEASAKFFNSFVNELSIMVTVSHPNIVKFVGFVEDTEKGDAWIVLPWEANGNVREFLASGEWDIPERLSLIQDVVKGVEYLHTRQPPICHGDLKSMNILVNSSYHAVITDFGSARAKEDVEATTENGGPKPPRQMGIDDIVQDLTSPKIKFNRFTLELTLTGPGYTLRWTAPEVLRDGPGAQDLRSDMWALGWICWEIVTGRIPFEEINAAGAIISTVIKRNLPAIREEADLSQVLKLCSLMMDCWMSNPRERIDSSTFRRKVHFMPSSTPSADRSGGAKLRSAALLLELGKMYALQDNRVVAESHYQSAMEVATQTKDDRAKAKALQGLGETYNAESRYREAEKAFMEAHEIHTRIGDHTGAANALDGLGQTYISQSRNQKAEKALTEAHQIHSRIGDDLGAANALQGLGYIYHAQLRNREAEKTFMEAHQIHSRIGNDLGAANALDGLGRIYRAQSRNQEAEKAFMEAHEIHSRIGSDLGAANALGSLGQMYHVQLRNQEGERAFVEAREIYSRIGNDLGAANSLEGLGQIYRAQSRNQEAERAFMEAREIHSRIGHDLGAANALDGLGRIYRAQSRNQEAEKAFMEAHEIHSRIGSDLGAANALVSLGQMYHVQSRNQEGERAFVEAREIYSRIGNDLGAAKALRSLGDIYYAQSRKQEAEKAFMEAREIYSRIGNDLGAANALVSLGRMYHVQSRNQEGERAFMEANEIHSRIGNDLGAADALAGLGWIYRTQSRNQEAEKAFMEANEIHSRIGNDLGAANALEGLGWIYRAQLRNQEAEKAFTEAHEIHSRIGNDRGAANALIGLRQGNRGNAT